MARGYILLSCLVLGVLFRLYPAPDKSPESYQNLPKINFIFVDRTLDTHSWVYFFMEHIIALAYALCIINPKWLRDDTPQWILWFFFVILCLDTVHFVGWFRDETVGWNLAKVVIFTIPLIWIQLKQLWNQ